MPFRLGIWRWGIVPTFRPAPNCIAHQAFGTCICVKQQRRLRGLPQLSTALAKFSFLGLGQVIANGVTHELGRVVQVQLAEDFLSVGFHCPAANA